MLAWIMDNIGSILVVLVLCGIVVCVVTAMIRDRKKGKSSCGGNCGHCPMGCSCHNS